jgi:sporulation protein YlmC with PRC-barrel domain
MALIIYNDDNNQVKKTYSEYKIDNGVIIFYTKENKITIPISRIIKIKGILILIQFF